MFTGIVEELGQVKALSLRGNSGTLTVKAKKVLEGLYVADESHASSMGIRYPFSFCV